MSDAISICSLYPDLLGTYGDGGNAIVLERRLQWRGIDAEVVSVNLGEAVPEGCDVYLLGGGEDQPQTSVTSQLSESRALHRAVDNGAAVLAVCAGMQILGQSFPGGDGAIRDGLGLLDVVTVKGSGPRRVGELIVQPQPQFGIDAMTGYENHSGVTSLGAGAEAFATVLSGKGNDSGDGAEGAVTGRVVGTYLHGPVLARNAGFADKLLEWAVGAPLAAIDDSEIEDLRAERLRSAQKPGASAGLVAQISRVLRRR